MALETRGLCQHGARRGWVVPLVLAACSGAGAPTDGAAPDGPEGAIDGAAATPDVPSPDAHGAPDAAAVDAFAPDAGGLDGRAAAPDGPAAGTGGELIFRSRFEGTTAIAVSTTSQFEDITGVDDTLPPPNDWVAHFEDAPGIGTVRVYYEGGTATQRRARVIPEPGNAGNRVLEYWMADANGGGTKGRIQVDVYGNTGLREVLQTVRLFLADDFRHYRSYPTTATWMTFFEFWNDPDWTGEPYPFRISVNLAKPDAAAGTDLYFKVHGQTGGNGWSDVWAQQDRSFPVPLGKWIRLDVYFKEGNATTGRFYFAATPDGEATRVIFDVRNFTHHPSDPAPDGLGSFNPMKLYTSSQIMAHVMGQGGVLRMFWDDFALWRNRAP